MIFLMYVVGREDPSLATWKGQLYGRRLMLLRQFFFLVRS
jgi:hypothetical protein